MIDKISYFEWAVSGVAVPKIDRKLQICVDYKVTITSVMVIDLYPLPCYTS